MKGISAMLVACLLLWPPKAFPQGMITLQRYLQQNDFEKNPDAVQHIFLRCFVVLTLVGHYSRQNADLNVQNQSKLLTDAGNYFLAAAQKMPRFNEKFAADQIQRMREAYRERWQRSKALKRNFNDDPILNS